MDKNLVISTDIPAKNGRRSLDAVAISGVNMFTSIPDFTRLAPAMPDSKRSKRDALIEEGTFNSAPDKVRDPKFRGGEFFDPHDAVQVKYEMLRRVSVDKVSITEAADEYGVSRPTYYQAKANFDTAGIAGLVHAYSAREEASARHSGEIHWLLKLQGALRDNKFELYFQPIVHARAGGVSGPALEVFVRLAGENGQPASPPAEFIRAAERYRLMPHVDRWVVQAVLRGPGPRRLEIASGPQRRHQYCRPDFGRCGVPGIRGDVLTTPAPIPATSVSR